MNHLPHCRSPRAHGDAQRIARIAPQRDRTPRRANRPGALERVRCRAGRERASMRISAHQRRRRSRPWPERFWRRSRASSATRFSSSRRKATSRASPIRFRSTIPCGCARSARGISRCRGRRPTASSWGCGGSGRTPPDLILSGVNRGQNIAEDVTYSGTIAAAMEGALLGVPSIALSQAYGGRRPRQSRVGLRRHARPPSGRAHPRGRRARRRAGQRQFPACAPGGMSAGVAVTAQGRRDTELMRSRSATTGAEFLIIG